MKRILFANIGWMIYYKGQNSKDKIAGGGSYSDEDKNEAYNFQNIDGWCYAYADIPRQGRLSLSRIDKNISNSKPYINNVLVIWTAKNPKKNGTYIVGWYNNATVYSEYQEHKNKKMRGGYAFNIKAKSEDCTLLGVDSRIMRVPRASAEAPGGMGQSNIWFADKDIPFVKQFRLDVVNYVNSILNNQSFNNTNFRVNVEARKKVEIAAVNFVREKYTNLGYKVVSVEKDNLGWDLEASGNGELLCIEVKGLAGEEVSVHLTPNEYSKMKNTDNSKYRLCVVTSAQTTPLLYTFMYDGSNWSCEINGKIHSLIFDESVAAIAYLR